MHFFPVKDYSFLSKSTRKHLLTYIKEVYNELEGFKGEVVYSSKKSLYWLFKKIMWWKKNNVMNNLKIKLDW